MTCPACGAPVADGARFCSECGQRLIAAADERRLVTVLMADLVGFTAFSAASDPEHVKRLVDACFDALAPDLGISVQMRVGVNTGEVLVGAMRAGGLPTVMGDVVNTTQRLQKLALPGQVIVGPA